MDFHWANGKGGDTEEGRTNIRNLDNLKEEEEHVEEGQGSSCNEEHGHLPSNRSAFLGSLGVLGGGRGGVQPFQQHRAEELEEMNGMIRWEGQGRVEQASQGEGRREEVEDECVCGSGID